MKVYADGWKGVIRQSLDGLQIRLAHLYRPLLGRTTFIGVTGSTGKTTTKELIAAMVATQGPCRKNRGTANVLRSIASNILRTFPWHRFCVHEISGVQLGFRVDISSSLALFRPQVGVVTNIGYDHYSAFRGLEATAREKGKLVEALPAEGAAVLNVDDPLVSVMRERTRARVITYGLSEEAMVRGEDIRCAWPEPLSLSVEYGGTRLRVQTQLLGEHWAHAVLAALATGIALGLPLPAAAAALRRVPPVFGRMSLHPMADGVTFIQDTWKASHYTVPASMRFLETAQAPRKVIIIGTISDSPGSAARRYRKAARQALEVADQVIFVGPWVGSALKKRTSEVAHRLRGFVDIYQLRSFLRGFLAPGDLVLLKGSAGPDHLERLVLDWEREFPCWRLNCGQLRHCIDCRLRHSYFRPDI